MEAQTSLKLLHSPIKPCHIVAEPWLLMWHKPWGLYKEKKRCWYLRQNEFRLQNYTYYFTETQRIGDLQQKYTGLSTKNYALIPNEIMIQSSLLEQNYPKTTWNSYQMYHLSRSIRNAGETLWNSLFLQNKA
jgi:hypothetical protein